MLPHDPTAARALGLSVFHRLPTATLDHVLADCRDSSVPRGHRFLGADQLAPYRTGLVVTGLLRMYLVSADGRQVTIRYAGPGYFIGAATVVGGQQQLLVTTGFEAVTDARVLSLNQDRLRATAQADAVGTTRETVARALGELRATGAIKSHRGGIHLQDPQLLASEAHLAAGGALPQLGEQLPLTAS